MAIDLAAFAQERGWQYLATAPPPTIEGAVFGALLDAVVTDNVVASGPIPFEVGNVAGQVGGTRTEKFGKVTVTMRRRTSARSDHGYVGIRLPRALPHFVVDAHANGSSLPIPLDRKQRVSLEGDFDEHFALYAPAGYERDALYLFTPDVMALLIDETGDLDVEVVGDRLTIYSPHLFDLRDPAVWERLEQIVRVLGAKAIDQAENYSDPRAAGTDSNVAPAGRRLDQGFLSRRGVWWSLVLLVAILIVSLVITIAGIFGSFALGMM
ncbi:hypothetical protein [Pseudolysinimonas yzui]|uniref:Uncharacterized protein n=1 Tax=Pseudolysinimonas yzui TaxID=2708254 RepID=A0A8J3M3D4_9MICO|nr:hypothetical protein [Pseudolysinimonas yzui]GHF22203.1 hypothetical protein GCM10011600_24170 [Pseudolysinimonas yzui]